MPLWMKKTHPLITPNSDSLNIGGPQAARKKAAVPILGTAESMRKAIEQRWLLNARKAHCMGYIPSHYRA